MKTYLIAALLIAAAVTPVVAETNTFVAPATPKKQRERPAPPIYKEGRGRRDPARGSRRQPAPNAQSESAAQIRHLPGRGLFRPSAHEPALAANVRPMPESGRALSFLSSDFEKSVDRVRQLPDRSMLNMAGPNDDMAGGAERPVVACYCATFLKPEMLHIYRQITSLTRVAPFVIAQKREEAERFPFDRITVVGKPALHFARRFWFKQVRAAPWQISQERSERADPCSRRSASAAAAHLLRAHRRPSPAVDPRLGETVRRFVSRRRRDGRSRKAGLSRGDERDARRGPACPGAVGIARTRARSR